MAADDRHLPVLASEAPEPRVIERAPVEPMPLSAPVAAATSGVLAGLAAMALVKAVRGGFLRRALCPQPHRPTGRPGGHDGARVPMVDRSHERPPPPPQDAVAAGAG